MTVTDPRAIRRVLRLRSLIAGPLMEKKPLRHDPVMLRELLELFCLEPGDVVVDGTLGLAGHSLRFIEAVAPGGTLVGLDWDESMLAEATRRIGNPEGVRVELRHSDFRSIFEVMADLNLQADAILLDLGLNSAQIEDADRGMSFGQDGPLDMRMDRSKGEPASAILNRMSLGELESMIWDFGDERWAKMIARRIVERRKAAPLRTTSDLVECVLAAIPPGARDKRINPSTRTFQAVRIYVNRELEGLEGALRNAAECLKPGGVLAVLSYHSGEDRIVKNAFRDLAKNGFRDLYKKPLLPGEDETRTNPRSRSAKLRALARSANDFEGKEAR
jgi:16S rRNA (cytosine1402-N4)-methyltransferase